MIFPLKIGTVCFPFSYGIMHLPGLSQPGRNTVFNMGERDQMICDSIKLAFFDVDGTLSAPQYPHEDGRMDIGFTEGGWMAYCEKTGVHGYDFCRPLSPVRSFAEKLHSGGTRLFVLSSCLHPNEHAAKTAFIQKNYPDLFEDFYYVFHDGEKIPVIEKAARNAGVPLSSCLLVEDTYSTLLKAYEAGITAVHVANIIAGNLPDVP